MKDVILNLEQFQTLATLIAEHANIIQKVTNYYTSSNVEISMVMMDYKDGKGPILISRVMVRNPGDHLVDLYTDIDGTPVEALEFMLSSLKEGKYSKYEFGQQTKKPTIKSDKNLN